MNVVDAAALPSMLPPELPKSRATRRYSKEEWNAQRDFITGMYHIETITVKKVVAMLEDRGFVVTERQLKRKASDWGLDKNVKRHEMKAIVRKQQRRRAEGKATIFRVRGQPVDQGKIDRWQKKPENHTLVVGIQEMGNSPAPTTPTLSVISYDAFSEPGGASPYMRNARLRTDLGRSPLHIENTWAPHEQAFSSINSSSADRNVTSYSLDLDHIFESNDGDDVGDDDDDDFVCQSPAPFTAPPSPAASSEQPSLISAPPRFIEYQDRDQTPLISSQETSSTLSATGPSADYFRLPQVESVQRSRKIRYQQKEEDEHRQRLHDLQAAFGPNHPATLDTLARLATIFGYQGRFSAAKMLLEQEIEVRQRVFGNRDQDTLGALGRLSDNYIFRSKITTATKIAESAYKKASEFLPSYNLVLLQLKRIYANCLSVSGYVTESESLLHEVIKAGGSTLPADHDIVLAAMESLSILMAERGDYEEAEKIAREVTQSNLICFGSAHRTTLFTLSSLGEILSEQKKYAEAQQILEEVVETQIKFLGREHPDVISTQRRLGKVYNGLDRYVESEALLREVLEKAARVQGKHHTGTFNARIALIQSIRSQGRSDEAETAAKKLLADSEKMYGFDHRCTCTVVYLLGLTHRHQGRLEEARSMFERSASGFRRILGEIHLATRTSLDAYTAISQEIQQTQMAQPLSPPQPEIFR